MIFALERNVAMYKKIKAMAANSKGKIKYLLIPIIVIITYIIWSSPIGTYSCVNEGDKTDKIVLKLDKTYFRYDDKNEDEGSYKITKYNLSLNSRDDENSTLIREGNFLYSNHGWYMDDSPYFDQRLQKGKKINQTLSYVSEGSIDTLIGNIDILIQRELKLKKNGTYTYITRSVSNDKEHKSIEKGNYKRSKRELKLTSDSEKNRILPIVNNKVVYVKSYAKKH